MKSLHVYGGATAEWVLRSLLTRTTNTGLIDTVWVRQRCCTDKIEGQKTLQLEDKMFSIRLESSNSWQFVFIVSIVQTSPVSSSSPCGLNIPRMKAPDSLLHYIELCTHQYYHIFLNTGTFRMLSGFVSPFVLCILRLFGSSQNLWNKKAFRMSGEG